jgi:RNA polymerase sigma factor (sigma-70 family)
MPGFEDDEERQRKRDAAISELLKGKESAHRSILRLVQSRDVADDVINEAWERMLPRPDLGDLQDPQAFFMATAFNVLRERWRKDRRFCLLGTPADMSDDGDGQVDPLAQVRDESPSVEEIVDNERLRRALDDGIEQMDPCTRKVFVRTQIDDRKNKVVAQELGLSRGQLDRRLAEARLKLRRRCRAYLPPSTPEKDVP